MSPFPAWLRSLLGLLFFFVVTFLAAAAGVTASMNAPDVYAKIVQPSWAPPAWLFGPVWSALYCMMAVAAWLVWRKREDFLVDLCLSVYLVHLIFQGLWSWLFFAWGRADFAMFDILLLWLMIAWMIIVFWRISRIAAVLMIPYLLWVTFASVLNGTLWFLNGSVLPQ